ncbi:MAG: AmmeMemoRadiSam system protein A [Candidatus Dormibacteraeota bacterium]|nr:AmmeMemoRadiSam system protein A [Candidatus Dormibacteraeota bacterium]
MPGIVAGALVAHPPVLVPEVGGPRAAKVAATAAAMQRLDADLSQMPGDLLIVISPHGPAALRELPLRRSQHVAGDLRRFGAAQISVECEVDLDVARGLTSAAASAGFPLTWSDDAELDHGAVVPLHLLSATRAGRRFVLLGISGWPLERLQQFGAFLHTFLGDRDALLLASGDLSHRLTRDAPYGFRPEGAVFDHLVIDALSTEQWDAIERLDPELSEQAGECGLRPLAMLLGAARAGGLHSEVLNYEGPFGVGYPVVRFGANPVAIDLQELGRRAIATYLREGRLIDPPDVVPMDLRKPSAAFVTLRKAGELRGCMGSIVPTEASAIREIIRYAVASAIRDPRFEPVTPDEVPALTLSAQLLDPPEPVTDAQSLDPAVYGVIVRRWDRQALLLPGITGIVTAEEQIAAACQKAGIDRRAPLRLERFRTRTLA